MGDVGEVGSPLYLAEDLLGVRLQLGAQLHARQVSLQQQVGLDVGIVELGVGQFVGNLLGQLQGETRKPSVGTWGQAPSHRPRAQVPALTCRSKLSSWCRMGMFSYSAALEMISMSPRTLVLALRDMLKSSGEAREGEG